MHVVSSNRGTLIYECTRSCSFAHVLDQTVVEVAEDEGSLGHIAFVSAADQLPPRNGIDHEDMAVPDTLETDDHPAQHVLTANILSGVVGSGQMTEVYKSRPTKTIPLSQLRKLYLDNNVARALSLLSEKVRVRVDDEYKYKGTDPALYWTREEVSGYVCCRACILDIVYVQVRLDYKFLFPNRIGLDVCLPNITVPEVREDPTWTFYMITNRRHWGYRGHRAPMGFDVTQRMMYLGNTGATDDLWLVIAPEECVAENPMIHDVEEMKTSTVMDSKAALIVWAFIAYVLDRVNYKDFTMHIRYPKIDSLRDFNTQCGIL